MKEIYSNFRDARMVEILKVEVNEGEGVQGDPIRRVCYLINPKDGKVLAKLGEDLERKFSDGCDQMYDFNSLPPPLGK